MTSPTLRRPPRVPFTRLLRVLPAGGGGAPKRLWAQNVSIQGMFIRTAEPLPVGTRLRIGLSSPDCPMLDLGEARVCWQRPMTGAEDQSPGFGVEFVRLEESARVFLEGTVSRGVGAARMEAEAKAKAKSSPPSEVEPPRRAPGWKPERVADSSKADSGTVGKVLPFRSTGS